jgi:hypothetical protein
VSELKEIFSLLELVFVTLWIYAIALFKWWKHSRLWSKYLQISSILYSIFQNSKFYAHTFIPNRPKVNSTGWNRTQPVHFRDAYSDWRYPKRTQVRNEKGKAATLFLLALMRFKSRETLGGGGVGRNSALMAMVMANKFTARERAGLQFYIRILIELTHDYKT